MDKPSEQVEEVVEVTKELITLQRSLVQDHELLGYAAMVVNADQDEMLECAQQLEKEGIQAILTKTNALAFNLLTGYFPTLEANSYPTCELCKHIFLNVTMLEQHKCNKNLRFTPPRESRQFRCARCDKIFLAASSLGRHERTHGIDEFTCFECGKEFATLQAKGGHMASHKKQASYARLLTDYKSLLTHHSLVKAAYRELNADRVKMKSELENDQKLKGKLLLLLTVSTKQQFQSSTMMTKLKEHGVNLPIFVMLRDSQMGLANEYLENGATGVVSCPLKAEDVKTIKHFLQEQIKVML